LVEHATENCGVVSSILTLGTPDLKLARPAGVVQLVERLLAKEKVMGSNPIARSIYLYGVVAKWQGKGLQNPDHGFKSRRRLSKLLLRAAIVLILHIRSLEKR
jgi:hypothetical protein